MGIRSSHCTPGRHRAVAVLGGAVAAGLVFVVASALGVVVEVPESPGGDPTALILPRVLLLAAVSGALGWALATVLERRAARPRRTWTTTALAVLVLSMAPVVGLGPSSAETVVLTLLHVVVAAVVVPMVAVTLPAQRTEDTAGTAATSRPAGASTEDGRSSIPTEASGER